MGALLDDPAVIHDEDRVGVPDRGQPVGDDEARPSQHQPGHGPLDEDLRARVHGARRLVEDEDPAVGQEGSSDRQELHLTLRHAGGVVVEDRVVPVGERPDEMIDMGGLGRGRDLLLRRIVAAVGDVLADRPVEEPRVLEDHPERGAKFVPRHRPAVDPVDRDPARVDLVEAHQEVDQGRLARAGRPDDGDGVTRLDDEVQVLDERGIGEVAEGHVLQFHPAGDGPPDPGERDVRRLLRLVEQLEDALRGRDRRLDDIGDAGGLGDRHRELTGVLDERLDTAEAQLAVRHLDPADDGDRDVVDVGDERHRGLDHPGQELGSIAGLEQLLILQVEAFDGLALAAERLDDVVSGVHLLDVAVEPARLGPLRGKLVLRAPGDGHGHRDGQRHREERDDGEERADPEHHREDADDRAQGRDELSQGLLEGVGDVVDVVRDATERVAARMTVEVSKGQAGQLLVHVEAHPIDGALGDPGHEVRLPPGKDRAQDVDRRDDEQDVPEGREVDAGARGDGHAREQVRLLGMSRRAQGVDRLLLGHPGRDLLAGHAAEQDVRGIAEDLGSHHGEADAQHGHRDDDDDQHGLGAQRPGQSKERTLEVLRLFGRQARTAERASAAESACGRPTRAAGAAGAAARRSAHAASSVLNCEYTISR